MHTKEEKLQAFGRLLDVMDELREKCPWDHKQTNESLRPNTIEETFELCDALLKDDVPNIEKELGDVLLHIVFYAKIGSEKGQFDIADVCNKLCDKLIFRHPGNKSSRRRRTATKRSSAACPHRCLRSSKPTAYRTKPAPSASTGTRRKMSGKRFAKNSGNYRQSSSKKTI